jgi:hypothetical protein
MNEGLLESGGEEEGGGGRKTQTGYGVAPGTANESTVNAAVECAYQFLIQQLNVRPELLVHKTDFFFSHAALLFLLLSLFFCLENFYRRTLSGVSSDT